MEGTMKSDSPVREKQMNIILETLENLVSHSSSLRARLDSINSVMFGPEAKDEATDPKEKPDTIMGRLAFSISDIRFNIEGIDNEISRLERDI